MKVSINRKTIDVSRETTLLEVVQEQKIENRNYVVAVNDRVMPKGVWQKTILSEGDQISVFSVIAGG